MKTANLGLSVQRKLLSPRPCPGWFLLCFNLPMKGSDDLTLIGKHVIANVPAVGVL